MPFTIIPEADCVRLIGGEDIRYTLRGPAIERWLPALLGDIGTASAGGALASVPEAHRRAAESLITRLVSERVLVEAPPRPRPSPFRIEMVGAGALAEALRGRVQRAVEDAPVLRVLVQETLDYGAALAFDRAARREVPAWLWVTSGPAARALVSPVFLADGGPCAGCMLAAFRRLSPAAELYDALLAHGARGGAFAATPLSDEAASVVAALVAWKARALAEPDPPAAVFELHALELASFAISTHPLAIDPDCAGAHEGA